MAAVAGCGWHPLYAPSAAGDARDKLARIEVAIIPERSGQLLRQALQARLQQDGAALSPAFVLDTRYAVSQEGIGFTADNSFTRVRMIGTASFVLRGLAPDGPTCVSGTVRDVDGFDEEDQQFFAADLEAETVQRRLAEAIAQAITTRLAMALRAPGRVGCAV